MRHMVQKIILVIALVAVLIPRPVQAAGLEEGGGLTGMIVEHVNRRMADGTVDLVHISHENGEVWVVAGFLVPRREGLVYVSNGPWSSSGEIASYLHVEVSVRPYLHADPYLQRIGSLFEFTHILFVTIHTPPPNVGRNGISTGDLPNRPTWGSERLLLFWRIRVLNTNLLPGYPKA